MTQSDDESFQRDYPRTTEKIQVAEAALWSSDEGQLTVVGHTCREAIQAFAGEALERLEVAPDEQDVQHTVARMRQVIATTRARPAVGDAEGELLDDLFNYWGSIVDAVQRQEHGGQREKEPVTHEGARRALFQTINVTHEIARSVERVLIRRSCAALPDYPIDDPGARAGGKNRQPHVIQTHPPDSLDATEI